MPKTQSRAATHVGLHRSNNEDSYLDSPENGLWIVADGMGGHAAGEVASSIAVDVIKQKVLDEKLPLSNAIQQSHRAVITAANNGEGGKGMGSTVVALTTEQDEYRIGWVGDSRAYRWNPNLETPLKRLTTDHSYVQMLYESGLISEAELETHPEKNIITQCLGSTELENVNVSEVTGTWQDDEIILLCSDGLSDAVNDETMVTLFSQSTSIASLAEKFTQAALSAGGKDNITLVLISSCSTDENNWFTNIGKRIGQLFNN